MVYCIYRGVTGYNFQISCINFLSLNIVIALALANGVDTDGIMLRFIGVSQFVKVRGGFNM